MPIQPVVKAAPIRKQENIKLKIPFVSCLTGKIKVKYLHVVYAHTASDQSRHLQIGKHENQFQLKPKHSLASCLLTSQMKVRPLQFNYLSYELFLEKKSCQTPKKKEKKVIFGVLRTKVVLKFSVRLQKKKKVQVLRIFFVSVIQSTTGSYHCCSRASDLRRYTSHPSGYRD